MSLSAEDRLILASAAAGETVHDAAGRLNRSPDWIRHRRGELLRRFEVPSITALVALAVAGGWLEPAATTTEVASGD